MNNQNFKIYKKEFRKSCLQLKSLKLKKKLKVILMLWKMKLQKLLKIPKTKLFIRLFNRIKLNKLLFKFKNKKLNKMIHKLRPFMNKKSQQFKMKNKTKDYNNKFQRNCNNITNSNCQACQYIYFD